MNPVPIPALRPPSRYLNPRSLWGCVLAGLALSCLRVAVAAEPYTWDNVRLGGGGYVTGLVIHPQNDNLWYARTDVGGIYRYDHALGRLVQLVNFPTPEQFHLYGGYGVDVHPTNQNIVYVALGVGHDDPALIPNGVVYKSVNQGATWTSLGLNKKMMSNDNEWGYKAGKPLVVNPHDPRYIFCGTHLDGLFRYDENSPGWTSVLQVAGTKIHSVVFHPTTTNVAFVAVSTASSSTGAGIYRSVDGGASFTLISGSPKTAIQLKLSGDGSKLYAATKAGVFRLDNPTSGTSFTSIAPETKLSDGSQLPYRAFAVDPTNASKIFTAPAAYRTGSPNLRIYSSTTAGATGGWTLRTSSRDTANDVPWHTGGMFGQMPSDIAISPGDPNVALMGDFFTVRRTANVNASPIVWSNAVSLGHEEVCVLEMAVAPASATASNPAFLFSGSADVSGHRHTGLAAYPTTSIGEAIGKEITGLAVAPSNDNYVYAYGAASWNAGPYKFAASSDNGVTWTVRQDNSTWGWGRIAVSATNHNIVVAGTRDAGLLYSSDGGVSFQAADAGAPAVGVGSSVFSMARPLAADGANGNTFYLWNAPNVYRSTNAGKTWSLRGSIGQSATISNRALISVPGREGHLFVTRGSQGLARSLDGGGSWTTYATGTVAETYLVAVGKGQTPTGYPAIYIYGRANGDSSHAFYRSTNEGASWDRISIDDPRVGNKPGSMVADQKVFGRVYVGTAGTGVYYGTPTVLGASTGQDIGGPAIAGSVSSTSSTAYTIRGGGNDIWGTSDKFHFLHQPLNGDVRLIARVDSLQHTDIKAKAGLMIRESTAANARNVNLVVTAANGVQLTHRATAGGTTVLDATTSAVFTAPRWVKLERHGNIFTAWDSPDGLVWSRTGAATFTMNTTGTRVGLGVTAHNDALLATANFSGVDIAAAPVWTAVDVGAPGAAGSTTPDYANDIFLVRGAGDNIYGTTDEFHFYHRAWTTGDLTIVADVNSVTNTHAQAKAGIMIRQSLANNSAHAMIGLTPGNEVEFLRRTGAGGSTTNTVASVPSGGRFLRLVRSGNQITVSHSADGVTWTQLGTQAVTMSGTVYVGLVNCSHVDATLSAGSFSSVHLQ